MLANRCGRGCNSPYHSHPDLQRTRIAQLESEQNCSADTAYSSVPQQEVTPLEVSLIVTRNVAGKPSGTLAVENHQLCQSLRIANRLFVIRDGTLGLGDRSVLPPEHIRPKPSVNGLLVGLQHVLSQAKSSMKERLILLVRGVEALTQSQQLLPDQNLRVLL
jgi:hypothetical protein